MAKNICILATSTGISAVEFASIKAHYEGAHFTLIVPNFDGEVSTNIDIWTDGARRGFLKVLTISRRMSWASFDLVINWEQGGLESALCFMLLPKPKIIVKADILRDIA